MVCAYGAHPLSELSSCLCCRCPLAPSGRWSLPDNRTGLDCYGKMMYEMDNMVSLMTAYRAIQGIVIIGMIFRMLSLWNFQGQVGIVTRTLLKSVSALQEFLIMLVVLMVLYSFYGVIVTGGHVANYTTFQDTFYALFAIIVAGEGLGAPPTVAPPALSMFIAAPVWDHRSRNSSIAAFTPVSMVGEQVP